MHSITPWRIEYNEEADIVTIFSGDKKICYMTNFHQSGVGHEERFHNAELICGTINQRTD